MLDRAKALLVASTIAIGAMVVGPAQAGVFYFNEESDFFTDTAGYTLGFESFENLPVHEQYDLSSQTLTDFVISSDDDDLGVWDNDHNFRHATDGIQYVQANDAGGVPTYGGSGEANPAATISFEFFSPIRAFAVMITDLDYNYTYDQDNNGFLDDGIVVSVYNNNVLVQADDSIPEIFWSEEGEEHHIGYFSPDQVFDRVDITLARVWDATGFDEVYYTDIPEPSGLLLFGVALLGVARARRRGA
ncbi:MAG: PEP-CTERM sorting domain-containing protein [Alphaproteobacteria bacterium]|jgi:hypothetical protein|nr:PEP-CTERM sorting domain-containing protein [Alphaproteobacteria bacterium]MDP6816197.1 PEP-CTERM sorting domain-containing protein [Alphaproteobacteria bacterium]